MSLAAAVRDGNRLALARLLSQVENATEEGMASLNELFPYTGRAHLIGVTGAPGTGKSSLVNQLALAYRRPAAGNDPKRVAIVAVDPSSPFSGGAILGDRVRMRDLSGDAGVFIRSMASRGSLGGLAAATAGLVQVFDAAGFEKIFIETVGAGQAEVDIARLAHTTIVVEAPGLGDDIQAIKAGILEIADLLVINKADRPMVDSTERALRAMFDLTLSDFSHHHPGEMVAETDLPRKPWQTPILRTVATEGMGIQAVYEAIEQHFNYLIESREWHIREQLRLQAELDTLIRQTLVNRWQATISSELYQSVLNDLVARRTSPHQALQILLDGEMK
ncbi:MAG: methylmalonyl Co-A mutase-associated GTPase MeaB [Chloroflexota bacterium]